MDTYSGCRQAVRNRTGNRIAKFVKQDFLYAFSVQEVFFCRQFYGYHAGDYVERKERERE